MKQYEHLLPYDKKRTRLIKVQAKSNLNYGTVFSWWDRLANTFRIKKNPRTIQYGIDKINAPYWQTFIGMIKTPFTNKF